VSFIRILRLREVARMIAGIALEFDVSLFLTPLCCDDIHAVMPHVSALAGCDNHVYGTGITPPSTRREGALEAAYGNSSIKRVHTIRDQLRLIQKGTKPVAEYGRLFKTLCDQLAAIGHPVDESDQLHWFLYSLGLSFETFSTSIRSARPAPSFADLLARTESHEMFYQALHRSSSPTIAFTATHQPPPSAGGGRGGRSARAPNETGGRGRERRHLIVNYFEPMDTMLTSVLSYRPLLRNPL
ncbi:putative RNA-directed DNA polymerase, partial [Tanacetum coccineum]